MKKNLMKFLKSINRHTRHEMNGRLNDALHSVFNQTSDAIALFHLTGEIFHCNKQFLKLVGSFEGQTSIKNIYDWLGSHKELNELVASISQEKQFEKKIKMKTVEQGKQAIFKYGPLTSEGKVFGGYVVVIDITKETASYEERDSRLRKLIDSAGIGIVVLDQNHCVIDSNQRFADMLGYSQEELYELHIWDWDADMTEEVIREQFKDLAGLEAIFETRHRRKDGSVFPVEIGAFGVTIVGDAGSYSASICICQDITIRKELEWQLKSSEARFKNLVENASEIILSLKEDGSVLYISPNCEHITGYRPDEIQGEKLSDFFMPEQTAHLEAALRQSAESGNSSTSDFHLKHKDGSKHWYSISFSSSHHTDGNAILICHARNIDERKEYEKKLQYLSTHDQLTGTYNRRFFDAFLEHQSKLREYPLTLIVCDIDRLKSINDTYGHEAGDRIIKSCAKAVQSSLRQDDYLVRTGGDEFVAILSSTDEKDAKNIVDRIEKAIETFNQTDTDLPLKLSVSTGSATALSEDCSIDKLLKIADARMYEQKNKE